VNDVTTLKDKRIGTCAYRTNERLNEYLSRRK